MKNAFKIKIPLLLHSTISLVKVTTILPALVCVVDMRVVNHKRVKNK